MTDKKENSWIKFVPSLNLPKERVSIAYDTHDERYIRYAYGYFQFYNGTCGCFWKDGNEQPKVIKAEDIKYWMPVPSLDVQEEPVSEKVCMYSKDNYTDEDRKVLCDGCEEECEFNKKEKPINDSFEIEVKNLWMEINTGHNYSIVDSYNQFYGLCMEIAEWQKQKDANLIFNAKEDGYRLGLATMKQQMVAKAVDATVHIDAGGYPFIPQIELYDYDKDIPLAKEGEKVKVIVIKED